MDRMSRDTMWANGLRKAFGYDPTLYKCGTQMGLSLTLSDFRGMEGLG